MPSPAARFVAAGLDYDHGTGHGVGSYLSVHEGPVSISRLAVPVPIEAGMILSNEPGYLPAGPLRHPPGKPGPGATGGFPEPQNRSCASKR